jgi:hypothetical protein
MACIQKDDPISTFSICLLTGVRYSAMVGGFVWREVLTVFIEIAVRCDEPTAGLVAYFF